MANEPEMDVCGAWPNRGGCILPRGHNQGKADVPEAHYFFGGVVAGMGPDAPVITNEEGGSQSEIPFVFTTLPLRAIGEMSKLQAYGDAKYGPHNWRLISEADHINHAFAHMLAHCLGDRTDDHLTHAAWRLLAAMEVRAMDQEAKEKQQ